MWTPNSTDSKTSPTKKSLRKLFPSTRSHHVLGGPRGQGRREPQIGFSSGTLLSSLGSRELFCIFHFQYRGDFLWWSWMAGGRMFDPVWAKQWNPINILSLRRGARFEIPFERASATNPVGSSLWSRSPDWNKSNTREAPPPAGPTIQFSYRHIFVLAVILDLLGIFPTPPISSLIPPSTSGRMDAFCGELTRWPNI